MRSLRFIVEGQMLKPDPKCDFENLVPGTEGYLKAEFVFLSSEWANTVKIVSFFSAMGKEYQPQILKNGKSCIIPKEALTKRVFKIRVTGTSESQTITTNKVAIRQNGG